jgi:hypothetical protein
MTVSTPFTHEDGRNAVNALRIYADVHLQSNSGTVMGGEEDPKDGGAVAGAVFGAVFIYIVSVDFLPAHARFTYTY